MPSSEKKAPHGSIIVKENMNADREVTGITVMAKVNGYDPESVDWFWAAYTPDGSSRAAGKLGGCIGCHEGMADNDFVIIRQLDAASDK